MNNTKETDTMRAQVIELKDKLRGAWKEQEESEENHKKIVEDLRKTITTLQEKNRQELVSAESDYKKRAHELETQLHKHRDRTIALLIEKDREIDKLRANSPEKDFSRFKVNQLDSTAEGEKTKDESPSSEETAAVSHLLSRPPGVAAGENTLLHFTEEMGRMKVEMNTLRKHKRQLETTLREMELNHSSQDEKYKEQITLLKEEIQIAERNKSRESANLEYLKNVVFQYMVCTDSQGRNKMFNAISIILQFSPKEKQAVHSHHQGWWGTSYSSSSATTKKT